ncbi:MAG: dihydrodipicolinate synthase family protein [Chitinophagaceae bacterium]
MHTGKKYKGVVVPAVTPLTGQLTLDQEAVERLFESFHRSGVMPFIAGTTGEAASLPAALKKEYIRLAGQLKQAGTVLYAGISSNNLDESIALANYGFDNGVDVVAATLPSYYLLTEDEMQRYFETLADHINGPLIIYNIPATTHMSIPLHVADELSYHEKIVGAKDSERSEERLNASLRLWKDRPDFSYFLGWAAKSAEALLEGCDGLIPSTGNLYPRLYADMTSAAGQNHREEAFRLQALSDELGNLYQAGRSLGQSLWALKVLMQQEGLCQARVMPPLQGQPGDEEKKLQEGLRAILDQYNIKLS